MTTKTYQGSCQCGRITFEADIDLAAGTGKCNCTSCLKRRWWSVTVKPDAFRAKAGAEHLSRYQAGQDKGHGGFCTHCGVITYNWVEAAEWNDGENVAISVASLDVDDPAELVQGPVKYFDGKRDDWWSTPAETRHL